MKLNFDCVRDVLLFIEENHIFDAVEGSQPLFLNQIIGPLSIKYSRNDIAYSVKHLYDSNLIDYFDLSSSCGFDCWVTDIKPAGHDFLVSNRGDTSWNDVNSSSSKAISHR